MTKTPTVEIRVLSVKQPWADCLMLDKWVENRSWQTHYRGPLWIQAGLKTSPASASWGSSNSKQIRNC